MAPAWAHCEGRSGAAALEKMQSSPSILTGSERFTLCDPMGGERRVPRWERLTDDTTPAEGEAGDWLERFHRGDRETLAACYRDHFATVEHAIGSLLGVAERETVIHDIFSRLIAREDLRRSFRGGSVSAWLAAIARHQAIDTRRRLARDARPLPAAAVELEAHEWEEAAHARILIDTFRCAHLPVGWEGVFELRFLRQLPQRVAARQLSLHRTTLAYRELRIRRLLKRFLLGEDMPPRGRES